MLHICRLLWLASIAMVVVSCTGLLTLGQTPPAAQRDISWADSPSHRYLPPPPGAGNVLDQVKLLENLNELVGQNTDSSGFQLTPKQLELLNTALESFRNEKGELELPDPDSIPPQWINSLLPDPKQREQAKRMLEQFARDRQLPLKNSAEGLPKTDDQANSPANNQPGQSGRQTQDPKESASTKSRTGNQSGKQPGNQSTTRPRSSLNDPANGPANDAANGSDNQSAAQQRRADEPNDPSVRSLDNQPPSDSSALPGGIPPEYRNLFDKLKQFEQQQRQSLEANAPWQPERTGDPSGQNQRSDSASGRRGSSNENSPAGSRQSRSNSFRDNASRDDAEAGNRSSNNSNARPGSQRRTGPTGPTNREPGQPGTQLRGDRFNNPTGNSQGNRSAMNPDGSGWRSRGGSSADEMSNMPQGNSAAEGRANPRPQGQPAPASPAGQDSSGRQSDGAKSETQPSAQEQPSPLSEIDKSDNPFLQEFRSPKLSDAGQDPTGPRPSDAPAQGENRGTTSSPRSKAGFNVTRMAEQPASPKNNSLDMRQSIEQSGLAKSLKRIVEQTIKEQEAERAKLARERASQTGPGNSDATGLPEAIKSALRAPDPPKSSAPPQPSAANKSQAQSSALPRSPSASRSSGSNNQSSDQWSRWAGELWKSISLTPESARSAASSSPISAAPSLGMPEFRWTNSMTTVLLVAAALIAVVLWLSRRHLAEIATGSQKQSPWIASVVSDGLKTRADVIRAFHMLVRGARPVADWWTHRLVVRHFNQHTPQYAAAMSELANVYEQARYFPEDADLTPQQLEQARRIVQSLSQSRM